MRLLKSWTVQDSHFVETMSSKHIFACLQEQRCVLVTGDSGCGKTIRPHCLALEIEDEAHNINVVYDLNKIIPLNPGSFEIVKGTVIDKRIIYFPKQINFLPGELSIRKSSMFNYASQEMDNVCYEKFPSEMILIDCDGFYGNGFPLKKFEDQRNIGKVKRQGKYVKTKSSSNNRMA